MHALHGTLTGGAFFAADLVGFTAGLLITALLVVLTVRALKLPGAPANNVIFGVCGLCWSIGGLAESAMLASGMASHTRWPGIAIAVQFLGAAAFPVPILGTWQAFTAGERQQRFLRYTRAVAIGSSVCLSIALLYTVLLGSGEGLLPLEYLTACNATLFLCAGALIALRRATTPRAIYIPSLVIVLSVAAATAAMGMPTLRWSGGPPTVAVWMFARHLLLLIVLCSFFLYARFRYADIFIRYSLRILLVGAFAIVLAVAVRWIILGGAGGRPIMSPTVHVFGISVLVGLAMLTFAFADEPLNRLVTRGLFHAPDYRACVRQLSDTIRGLQSEAEVASAVRQSVQSAIGIEAASFIALDSVTGANWPDGVLEGEIIELTPSQGLHRSLPLPHTEFLVPVRSGGAVQHLILVAPGANRPALVSSDLNYLRTVAAVCGDRLDDLRAAREAVERRSHEALLRQQITEAELRALRSQINPHFLFNSLNTIADLIVRHPERAEEMTVRLADVFRHVLANSSRSLTSVSEEIEFLRTYLYIEEVRFRDRLQVDIHMAPDTAGQRIPSLILQPLVENALKHGLGPKPGPGHLWVSAASEGGRLRLCVEDDGVGPARAAQGRGLGLTNTAERLKALYNDRADLVFEPREAGGSRVTLLLPRSDEPCEA